MVRLYSYLALAIYSTANVSGPIVRIGPNELVTNDVETWRKVMNVRTAYTRSNWFDSLQLKPGCDNIVSQRDNAKHAALRSKMAPGV